MNVSAVNGTNWLPTEREKVNADNGNGFAEAIETAKAKETAASFVPTVSAPSYTVSDEEAEYFREKYGEDYNEEQPYQIFYELAEKKIISNDDACNASEYGRLIFVFCDVADLDEFNRQVRSGAAKECFSDYTCYGRYYDRFKGKYDNFTGLPGGLGEFIKKNAKGTFGISTEVYEDRNSDRNRALFMREVFNSAIKTVQSGRYNRLKGESVRRSGKCAGFQQKQRAESFLTFDP